MKRIVWILGLAVGLAILLILLNFINRQRMGEMTDLAYDPTRDRLYVVAGDRGLYTFEVDGGQLRRLSRFIDEGAYHNIEIQGQRAYIADEARGLVVLDISEERPRFIFAGEGLNGSGIHLAGGLLYLAAGDQGLIIYSLADPDLPQEIGRYRDLEYAWDVTVDGYLAFVTDEPRGLEILDVSSPAQPQRIGFVSWDPVYAQAEIVRSEAGFVYIAAGEYGLRIIDARIPNSAVVAAEYKPGPASQAVGLDVEDWRLYLTVRDAQDGSKNGLHILNVSNPYNPQLLSTETYAERSRGVVLYGETAFIANPSAGVRAYNLTDPTQPVLSDRFRFFP